MSIPSTRVDYFFSLLSPWAYLGHQALLDVVAASRADLHYRPMQFLPVLSAAGGQPLKERPLARQHYRLLELQRWRDYRGLPLNLQPRFFPVDVALADRIVIALLRLGQDPAVYVAAAGRALWAEERDLSDPAVLTQLLDSQGQDAAAVIGLARDEPVMSEYQANTEAAIAAELPGIPGYVLNGEPFWGQDRLDMLQHALQSRRAPYLT